MVEFSVDGESFYDGAFLSGNTGRECTVIVESRWDKSADDHTSIIVPEKDKFWYRDVMNRPVTGDENLHSLIGASRQGRHSCCHTLQDKMREAGAFQQL